MQNRYIHKEKIMIPQPQDQQVHNLKRSYLEDTSMVRDIFLVYIYRKTSVPDNLPYILPKFEQSPQINQFLIH
jgi:hypothetical protein